MKIGVCVKQVPAKDAPLAIVEGGAWIRESDIGFETNEPDGFALEEALRLKEKHGGEVVAISMGPERAKQTGTKIGDPRCPGKGDLPLIEVDRSGGVTVNLQDAGNLLGGHCF